MIRLLIAMLFAGATGLWGLNSLFSGIHLEWPVWLNLRYIAAMQGAACAVTGWLSGKRWYTAGIAARGAVLLGVGSFSARLSQVGSLKDWIFTQFLLVGILAAVLLCGFVGDRYAQRSSIAPANP
jgi:hypothetical protein